MEEYELAVEGMSCSGCEGRVTDAAEEVKGVHRAEADHESGTVAITAAGDAEDDVRRAIRDAGYDVPG